LQPSHLDKSHSGVGGVKDTEGHLRWFHFHLHPPSRIGNASDNPKFSERRHEFRVKSYARDSWLDQKDFYWTCRNVFNLIQGVGALS